MANRQEKDICAFLNAVPHLNALNKQVVFKLAVRFAISPESLNLLISIAFDGGKYYDN